MLGQWLLILTMVTNTGTAMMQVGPFTDASKCRAAGQMWFDKTYPHIDQYRYNATVPNYVCVER